MQTIFICLNNKWVINKEHMIHHIPSQARYTLVLFKLFVQVENHDILIIVSNIMLNYKFQLLNVDT